MELEVKEKYENFIKIIEKKEEQLWLKQNNSYQDIIDFNNYNIQDILKNENKNIENNDCICELSSGYSSFNQKNDDNLSKDDDNLSKNNDNLSKNEELISNEDSLLDESILSKNNNLKKDSLLEDSVLRNNLNVNYINDKNSLSNLKEELSLLDDNNLIMTKN